MRLAHWMNTMTGRSARVGAGITLIALGVLLGGVGGVALAVVGVVPLAAGATGVCLLTPALSLAYRGQAGRRPR